MIVCRFYQYLHILARCNNVIPRKVVSRFTKLLIADSIEDKWTSSIRVYISSIMKFVDREHSTMIIH